MSDQAKEDEGVKAAALLVFICEDTLYQTEVVVPDHFLDGLRQAFEAQADAFLNFSAPVRGATLIDGAEIDNGGLLAWLNIFSSALYGEPLDRGDTQGNNLVRFKARAEALDQQIIACAQGKTKAEMGSVTAHWLWEQDSPRETMGVSRWFATPELLPKIERLTREALATVTRAAPDIVGWPLKDTGHSKTNSPLLIQDALNKLADKMVIKDLGDHPWCIMLRSGFGAAIAQKREMNTAGPCKTSRRTPRARA